MKLVHLQNLVTLKPEALAEERNPMADFKGIKTVVEDALGDLCDKLCADGALHGLMKDTGAEKLDTVKDEDGHLVMQKLDMLTSEYKKAVDKLLVEVEALLVQVVE